jgi:VCBS repeat-containing protein
MTSKSYKIIVTATDGKDTATSTISLTVTDQNETPVFHQTEYSV